MDVKKTILLEILNEILIINGKEQINDVEQFKNISREEILKYDKTLDETLERLLKGYTKFECGYYRLKNVKEWKICVLRICTKVLGKKLSRCLKIKDENNIARKWIEYSIV